jgi:hypothetical protein
MTRAATRTIAIVVVKTDHDGIQAYIGTSAHEEGEAIVNEVAERGARFPLDAAQFLFLNRTPARKHKSRQAEA